MMLYVDLFIVIVALPAFGHDFEAPVSLTSWTIASYALMIGVFPMGMGRLADLWGQRRVYLAGLLLFTAASQAAQARAAGGFSIGAPITLPHSVHEPS
jgi:DHA2 family multidrug resistance protein-like MFS transporter